MKKLWEKYLGNLSQTKRNIILYNAIEHLIDIGEVKFRVDDIVDLDGNLISENESMDEFLYWVSCGESLLDE